MTNPYASEEETNALIQPDTRTPEQKQAAKLADENWLNEQGIEAIAEAEKQEIERQFDAHAKELREMYLTPQRQWVGLDDTDLAVCDTDGLMVAKYWERVLKEKNNG